MDEDTQLLRFMKLLQTQLFRFCKINESHRLNEKQIKILLLSSIME